MRILKATQIGMLARFSAFFAALLVVLAASFAFAADSAFACPDSPDYRQPQRFNGYTVRIVSSVRPSGKQRYEFRCLGTIKPPQGLRKVIGKGWVMSIDAISGNDISGAGKPEVVFDGHTSGARCCYEYWIASFGKLPRLIREIRSPLPAEFQKNAQGTVDVHIPDSAFQFFMLPQDQAVTPAVFFRFEGNKLVDVSSEHQAEYDEQIAKSRAQLAPDALAKFRQSRYSDKLFMDQYPAVKGVLAIVLNYLYSGREEQAWQALQKMWPESDQSRVKSTILERRSRGIASQLGAVETKPGA
jgi:hypothetical protein